MNFNYFFHFYDVVITFVIGVAIYLIFYGLFRFWKPLPFIVWAIIACFLPALFFYSIFINYSLIMPTVITALVGTYWSGAVISGRYSKYVWSFFLLLGIGNLSVLLSFLNPLLTRGDPTRQYLYWAAMFSAPLLTAFIIWLHHKSKQLPPKI